MTEQPIPEEILLRSVADTRARYEAAEARWKQLRAESRFLTCQLVTEHGISLARASRLSGHHVNVIRVWLQADLSRKSGG